MMKSIFLSEMTFQGKIPIDFPNMRTEFAWMVALDADHLCINRFNEVKDYDYVFIIFPKGRTNLSADGSQINDRPSGISELLQLPIIEKLKECNKKVMFVQEGPHWFPDDYTLQDQIGHYNLVAKCDGILCHNHADGRYYKGMFPNKACFVIPTLLIEHSLDALSPVDQEDKTIIGGNFSRWYGGFESHIVAQNFENPIWVQTSHSSRLHEDQMENLNIIPRVSWIDWMNQLRTFKYAVHLMPTVAAGTFSLNCAYFGIPCIGNIYVDTQRTCFPKLSVQVDDIWTAAFLARELHANEAFYEQVSEDAKRLYREHYDVTTWKAVMHNNLQLL